MEHRGISTGKDQYNRVKWFHYSFTKKLKLVKFRG